MVELCSKMRKYTSLDWLAFDVFCDFRPPGCYYLIMKYDITFYQALAIKIKNQNQNVLSRYAKFEILQFNILALFICAAIILY